MDAAVAHEAETAGVAGVTVTSRREGRIQETEFDTSMLALDRLRAARNARNSPPTPVARAPGSSMASRPATEDGRRHDLNWDVVDGSATEARAIRGTAIDVASTDDADRAATQHRSSGMYNPPQYPSNTRRLSSAHDTDDSPILDSQRPIGATPPNTKHVRSGKTKSPDKRDRSGVKAAYRPLALEDGSDADCSSSSGEHTPVPPRGSDVGGVVGSVGTPPRMRQPFLNLKSPSKFQQLPTVDWLLDTHRNKRERRTNLFRAKEVNHSSLTYHTFSCNSLE